MKKIILPLSALVLLGVDIMAVSAIRSTNPGLAMFGWVAIFTSMIIFAVFALQFLSNDKKK